MSTMVYGHGLDDIATSGAILTHRKTKRNLVPGNGMPVNIKVAGYSPRKCVPSRSMLNVGKDVITIQYRFFFSSEQHVKLCRMRITWSLYVCLEHVDNGAAQNKLKTVQHGTS